VCKYLYLAYLYCYKQHQVAGTQTDARRMYEVSHLFQTNVGGALPVPCTSYPTKHTLFSGYWFLRRTDLLSSRAISWKYEEGSEWFSVPLKQKDSS